MAAPTFIAASTGSYDISGAWTATCHAPGAAGRIIILQVFHDGTGAAPGVTSATNIEHLAGTDNQWTTLAASQPVGSPTAAYQHLYIGRSLSTSAPTFTAGNSSGDDLYWRYWEFDGVSTGTTLAEVIENGTAGSTDNTADTSATVADAGVTTLGRDRLAVQFIGINDDNPQSAFTGTTGGTKSYEDEILADSPVFLLRMSEGSGDLTDVVGSKTATKSGSPTYGVSGPIIGRTAISFGSTSDYFTVTYHADLDLGDGPLTIEFWGKFTSPVSGTQYVAFNKGANSYSVYRRTANTVAGGKGGVGSWAYESGTTNDEVWHHWVLTKDGSTRTMYKDGSSVLDAGSTDLTLADNTSNLTIGQEAGTWYWKGALAYITFYKSVLSSSRITAHYSTQSWAKAATEYTEASGTDASIGLQIATMSTPGTIDGGTFTQADATDGWGAVGFALTYAEFRLSPAPYL